MSSIVPYLPTITFIALLLVCTVSMVRNYYYGKKIEMLMEVILDLLSNNIEVTVIKDKKEE